LFDPTLSLIGRELLKQNQALREKEAEQLKCLNFYEAWVKGLSSDADAAAAALLPDDSTDSSHLPTTVRLQRRVQKLKQILQPQAQDTQPSAPGPQLPSSAAARQKVIPEAFRSDSNGSAKAAGSDPSSAESQDSNTGGAEGPDEKMAAWFSAVTPEDLNYFRSMTPEDLAGGESLRGCVIQLQTATQPGFGGFPGRHLQQRHANLLCSSLSSHDGITGCRVVCLCDQLALIQDSRCASVLCCSALEDHNRPPGPCTLGCRRHQWRQQCSRQQLSEQLWSRQQCSAQQHKHCK
jgi:hypothetical protein